MWKAHSFWRIYYLYRLSRLKLGPACGPAVVQHHYADPCDSADRSDPRRALVWKTRLGLITAFIPRRETSAGKQLVRIVTLSFSTGHDASLVALFLSLLLYLCSPGGA